MNRVRSGVVTACMVLFVLAGCGRQADEPAPVEGKITQEGEPVANATITFTPEDGKGRRATGMSGADGTFKMTTRNTGDGVVPGAYKVTVSKQSGTATGDEYTDTTGADYIRKMKEMAMKGKKPAGRAKSDIHSSYGDEQTTALKFTIPAGGNKDLEIKLNRNGG